MDKFLAATPDARYMIFMFMQVQHCWSGITEYPGVSCPSKCTGRLSLFWMLLTTLDTFSFAVGCYNECRFFTCTADSSDHST